MGVDSACQGDGRLVAPGLGLEVCGQAVGQMGVGEVDVDVIEEPLAHIAVVRSRVLRSQTHVLVEVEGSTAGKVETFLAVQAD